MCHRSHLYYDTTTPPRSQGPPKRLSTLSTPPLRGLLHEYMGQKHRKCPKKACLEFVAAPQPAHAARKHRSRVGGTPWHPVSAANRPDGTGSTPRSLWGCNKLAAERATDGVPAEVMECET